MVRLTIRQSNCILGHSCNFMAVSFPCAADILELHKDYDNFRNYTRTDSEFG